MNVYIKNFVARKMHPNFKKHDYSHYSGIFYYTDGERVNKKFVAWK